MTDARLDLALRRAAEPVMRTSLKAAYDLRTGWAEAIRTLEYFHNNLHGGSSMRCSATMGCSAKPIVASFIKAMLGGGDGSS